MICGRGEEANAPTPAQLPLPTPSTVSADFRLSGSTWTHHPVRPHANGHLIDPALDDVVYLGRVGLLIECADEHEVEREMSAGRRLITVVHHGLVEWRVTLHHHEPIT